MSCIFCDITHHKAPAKIAYEDDEVMVFESIAPKAPIHLLIAPKKHIESINHLQKKDGELISHMFFVAKQVASEQKIADTGYRLGLNVGRGGGQIIDHLHMHLLGGWSQAQHE